MGQIAATRNLVATKVVRLAGQWCNNWGSRMQKAISNLHLLTVDFIYSLPCKKSTLILVFIWLAWHALKVNKKCLTFRVKCMPWSHQWLSTNDIVTNSSFRCTNIWPWLGWYFLGPHIHRSNYKNIFSLINLCTCIRSIYMYSIYIHRSNLWEMEVQ